MAATQKINFLTLVSYSLLQTVLFLAKTYRFATIQNVTDRQQTDRRHSVPKARLIVRSAKNDNSFLYTRPKKETKIYYN